MARFAVGMVFGLVVGVVGAAAAGLHAEDLDGIGHDTVAAAAEANVELVPLLGAMASTHLPARAYLIGVGELAPPAQAGVAPPSPAGATSVSSPLVECIIQRESRGDPNAVNPRSGASGLGQFLRSTWATTPQGRAGFSVFDPVANRAAVAWMIQAGRGREFATIGGCR